MKKLLTVLLLAVLVVSLFPSIEARAYWIQTSASCTPIWTWIPDPPVVYCPPVHYEPVYCPPKKCKPIKIKTCEEIDRKIGSTQAYASQILQELKQRLECENSEWNLGRTSFVKRMTAGASVKLPFRRGKCIVNLYLEVTTGNQSDYDFFFVEYHKSSAKYYNDEDIIAYNSFDDLFDYLANQ